MKHNLLNAFRIAPLALACVVCLSACNNLGFEKTKSGILYKIVSHGNSKKVKLGDFLEMNFQVKTDKDSVLTSTYKSKRPAIFKVDKSRSIGDLMDVFPSLSEKDSVIVKVQSDSLFDVRKGQMRPPFIKLHSFVFFVIKVEKVMNDKEFEVERNAKMAEANAEKEKLRVKEGPALAKYLSDKKIKADSTKDGVLYVIEKAGDGPIAKPGDTVSVNYTGETLNGKMFDTNDEGVAKANKLFNPQRKMQGGYGPFKYAVGTHSVIDGWDSFILSAKKGTKATLIIPSRLAYKDADQTPIMPPFSTLVFHVELLDVKPGKGLPKVPQMPQMPQRHP